MTWSEFFQYVYIKRPGPSQKKSIELFYFWAATANFWSLLNDQVWTLDIWKKSPINDQCSTIFFSNSRSLERPGLIIETLEYYCHCLYFGYLLIEVERFYCVQLQHNGLEDLEAGIFNYFLFWFIKKVKVVLKIEFENWVNFRIRPYFHEPKIFWLWSVIFLALLIFYKDK